MPGDKSISHRAGMIASLATGTSRIKNYSNSEDCAATLRCLGQLGVAIKREGNDVLIEGTGVDGLRAPTEPLDCGNSGTTMRLLAGILAGQNFKSTLTGDESLCSRPMQRIIEPLQIMGARISSHDGRAPLTIDGKKPLGAIEYDLLIASAQVKSCILLAGLNADGRTQVIEETPTRDHTERMLRLFGVTVESGDAKKEAETFVAIGGPATIEAHDINVPGDISSAAYFIAAAALLENSDLEIADVGINPTRTTFLSFFKSFGLDIRIEASAEESNEPAGNVHINGARRKTADESSLVISGTLVAGLIDELPLLAVVGSQLEGGIEIRNAGELRVKESDRIRTTVAGLRAMGAEVEEFDDGLRVSGPIRLRGAKVDPHDDHRLAMAFTVAALLAEGETEITNTECVSVSFPTFFELLESVVE
jgi:3-phosphoshikimate 1-carboxyvinyltransferase